MESKYKNYNIKEIWEIMPKRFQGMVYMLIISITIQLFSELQQLLNLDVWGNFGLSILLIVYIFWVVSISYNWMMKEDKEV